MVAPLPPLPEVNIKRILYATDLSASAKLALAYALDMANNYCAQLIILHVMDKVPEIVDGQVIGYIGSKEWETIKEDYDEDLEALLLRKTRSKEVMQQILKRMRRAQGGNGGMHAMNKACPIDLKDEVVVKRGQPVATILEVAKEKECDMIIMGSHGHSRLVDAMMGVTAGRVIRRAEVPVLVIRLPKE